MSGAQDMGGKPGFGPVLPEQDEPLFHAGWERRALGLTLAAGGCGKWNIDMSRRARETLAPSDYLGSSYYEIWIKALEKLVLAAEMAGKDEIAAGRKMLDTPAPAQVLRGDMVDSVLAKGSPYDRRPQTEPRFSVGDGVRMKQPEAGHHTRLPGYAGGKAGIVQAVRGFFVFPDTNAHGAGENPQWCYTICFAATELWGASANLADAVLIDAFEPYLDPV